MNGDKHQHHENQTGSLLWKKPKLIILNHIFTEAASGKKRVRRKERNKRVGS